jgi:hypothetical protein
MNKIKRRAIAILFFTVLVTITTQVFLTNAAKVSTVPPSTSLPPYAITARALSTKS